MFNMWSGIFHNHIVGSFFLSGNLTKEMYLYKGKNGKNSTTVFVENDK